VQKGWRSSKSHRTPSPLQTNDRSGAAGFVNTFAAPIAIQNITYWFYAFFVFWDCFEALFIYLFFVETRGRTLEELDEVFESNNPRKASTTKRKVRTIEKVDETGHSNVAEVKEV